MLLLTSSMKQNILLQHITCYPTLEVQYSKILSEGIDFSSLNQQRIIHLVIYTGLVLARLNDNW